jgi:hypothetical protein
MSSNAIRRIAWVWLLVGLLVLFGAGLLLVSYFVFGVPVHDRYSGKPTSGLSVLGYSAILGCGGALFAVMGRALLRWSKPKSIAHELDEPDA